MLRRDDDGIYAYRAVFPVILGSDLALAVGAEVRENACFSDFGKPFCELMRKAYRKRHALGGLIAGIAEHHALIAGACIVGVGIALFRFKALINAHCYIRRLTVDGADDRKGMAVEAVLGFIVADIKNDIAHEPRNVDIAVGRNLAHYHYHARGRAAFAGNA